MPSDALPNNQEKLFHIEDAKPEDVERMRAIVRDAWLQIYPNEAQGVTYEDILEIDWFNGEGLEKRRKEIIEKKNVIHSWVLKDEKGEVVGFCKASKLMKGKGEIDAMYVSSELQGRGLGRKLMDKAVEWFGPEVDLTLKVVRYNSNAINFYKKMGFLETGNSVSYEGTRLPGGKEIPRIEMVRLH